MPTPAPAQVRRKSSSAPKSPTKTLNLGSPIGPHGHTSVQDKIKKWQSQGGGAIIADDGVAAGSDSDVRPEGVGGAGAKHRTRDANGSPAPRDRTVGEVRKALAPKKRVVSDAHWVRKKVHNTPPPPVVEKKEAVWVRPSTRRKADGGANVDFVEEMIIRAPESPIIKPQTRNKSPTKAAAKPARKPTAIEAWVLDVHETPIPHSAHSKSRHSKSADSDDQESDIPRERSSRRRRSRVSDTSVAEGDGGKMDRPPSSRTPTTPSASNVDTRPPEERAAELVASRRAREAREKWRTRSPSAAAPPLDSVKPSPRASSTQASTDDPPPKASETSTVPERHSPRQPARRERHENRANSEPTIAENEEPPPRSRKRRDDDEALDVEIRRLQRSVRERKVGPNSESVIPSVSELDDEAGDVERRRLQRSLKERKFSYTPTIPDEATEVPVSASSEPTGTSRRAPSSATRERTTKSSHNSSSNRQTSRVQSDLMPPAAHSSMPPPLFPKVFGSRIDAWLHTTHDPFVDGSQASSVPSRSSRSDTDSDATSSYLGTSYFSSTVSDSVTPSDAISNLANRQERERRRAKMSSVDTTPKATRYRYKERSSPMTPQTPERVQDLGLESEVEPESPGSSSTLRRSGARKKRSSSSTTREQMEPLLHSSTPTEVSEATDSTTSSLPPLQHQHNESPLDESSRGLQRGSLPFKRPFPTTGKRLSTIASVETLRIKAQNEAPLFAEGSEVASTIREEDEAPSEVGSSTTLKAKNTSLKRKLTTHADLMSVLSLPDAKTTRSKTVISARSIRTTRSRLATATMDDLMNELASDEAKYMRELRTLVDGVIPVLLSCVLSKADSAVAAGLFRANGKEDFNVTKPIIEMGVALERLKSCHKRIPKTDCGALLSWAQATQKVYTDYIRAWRLGFQDVVVNLAHAENRSDLSADDELLPQNEDGDVVNSDGERVDVAFLLKRPLVRVKYLAKTFKGINFVKPSDRASALADAYQGLVGLARKRTNEEKTRLEDEAAAAVDPTRARDPKTLAPLAGVYISPTGFVKARGYFDMHLLHSSGQEIDCRVELLMRDGVAGQDSDTETGDMLVCEVDATGRWLFFPPIQRSCISARKGGGIGEIVLMVRGTDSAGIEWHETFSMKTTDDDAALEWIRMIGITPVPPSLNRGKSFVSQAKRPPGSHAASSTVSSSYLSATTASTAPPPLKSRTPSPRELEVPIGEKASASSRRWSTATPARNQRSHSPVSPITPPSDERHDSARRRRRSGQDDKTHARRPSDDGERRPSRQMSYERDEYESDSAFKGVKDALRNLLGNIPSTMKSSQRNRLSHDSSPSGHSPDALRGSRQETRHMSGDKRHTISASAPVTPAAKTDKSKGYSVWYPPSNEQSSEDEDEDDRATKQSPTKQSAHRPKLHRRASSVPKLNLPNIPKLRRGGEQDPSQDPIDEEPNRALKRPSRNAEAPEDAPMAGRTKLQKNPPARYRTTSMSPERETPPRPPPHRVSVNLPSGGSSSAPATPATQGRSHHRRTSSPLKHEYQPSTASESSTDGDGSTSGDESMSSDSELDDDDVPLALFAQTNKPENAFSPPETRYSTPNSTTISPSQSASQAPYRTVPRAETCTRRAIASIFSWSGAGHWEELHPDECSIVISGGLVEAFDMISAHTHEGPDVEGSSQAPRDASGKPLKPLIGLELTPIVPLRRGTAVDITIRSPPTKNSTLQDVGNNIMFRSRSPEEAEALYKLINWARINNPTYIALQNARGPDPQNTWAAAMERRNAQLAGSTATTGGGSWWQFGGSNRSRSYRASSTRAPSTSAVSSSEASTASLFSAMRRLGGGKAFNLAQSSVSWRHGFGGGGSTGRNSLDSLSGSGSSTTPPSSGGPAAKRRASVGMPEGVDMPPGTISTFVTRLYIREGSNKWRDLGSSRLHIMQPAAAAAAAGTPGSRPPSAGVSAASANSAPGVLEGAAAAASDQKRVLVLGKSAGHVLLDVTLGESAFEKVARSGVAVNVITSNATGTVAATGGVAGVEVKTYMIQFKDSAVQSYAFSLLGKLRY